MKLRIITVLFIASFLSLSYTDVLHYSRQFGMERTFRVFTPLGYQAEDTLKRYPVIYYFHGCRGSYDKDGFTSYAEGDTSAPALTGRLPLPDYDVPYNADFESYSDLNEVIIVSVDGKIPDFDGGGCGVYYPFHHEPDWKGNDFNFSLYIRELFEVVDSLYNTIPGPEGKALTGLSYGGHSSMWVSASNPHLISSCSQFSHSPHRYKIGAPPNTTPVNVQELWRNFRGLPFRSSTNTLDYLRAFSEQTGANYSGAGFESEEHLADFCRHWAADIPEQFDFHMKNFKAAKKTPACFSYVNLYPDFDVWGYKINTTKAEEGWTYLRDVTKNGFGLYSRLTFPYGKPCGSYEIKVSTPPIYTPEQIYTLARYSYQSGKVNYSQVLANNLGKLKILSDGGAGEEIGISGAGLEPPILFLSDTLNENIYIEAGKSTDISFKVINLSPDTLDSIVFTCTSSPELFLEAHCESTAYQLQAGKVTTIKNQVSLSGTFSSPNRNVAYLHLSYSLSGESSSRERIIQVNILDSIVTLPPEDILVFDGRNEELPVYSYDWGDWNTPVRSKIIQEGSGNGNGIPEQGEIFSVWIRLPGGEDPLDQDTWHPVMPLGSSGRTDFEGTREYLWSTGRALRSAQMSLPADSFSKQEDPLLVQSELIRMLAAEDCYRGSVDKFRTPYFNIILPE